MARISYVQKFSRINSYLQTLSGNTDSFDGPYTKQWIILQRKSIRWFAKAEAEAKKINSKKVKATEMKSKAACHRGQRSTNRATNILMALCVVAYIITIYLMSK